MSNQNYSNFFKKNFLAFLLNEKEFFEKNKKNYIKDFYNLIIKNSPNIINLTKELIENFYNSLFISPFLKTGKFNDIKDFISFLNQNRIETNLIDKSFYLIANKFIKNNFKTSNLEKLKTLSYLLDFYSKYLKSNINIEIISKEIPKEILEIFNKNKKIYLFSVYKSIPISNPSTILSIDNENKTVTINATPYQIIATNFQKEVYIVEPTKSLTFKAFAVKSNYYKKTITLSEIQKINRSALKRNYLRVQPKEDITAKIFYKDKTIEGTIFDISIKGISILAPKIDLHINDNVIVEFEINNNKFSFLSELKSLSEFNDLYRYHFYFEPTIQEENELEKYIKKREKEIVKELMFYMKKEFIELS